MKEFDKNLLSDGSTVKKAQVSYILWNCGLRKMSSTSLISFGKI